MLDLKWFEHYACRYQRSMERLMIPDYLGRLPEVSATEEVSSDFEHAQSNAILKWWTNNRVLTHWIDLLVVAVQLQPSSGSAERVFTMYTWMFDDDQDNALEDYKDTTLKMRFNEQDRVKE